MKKVMSMVLTVFVFAAVLLSCSADGDKQIVTVSKAYPRFDLTELATRAEFIVKGTVSGKSDPIKIKPNNGGDASLFTDYYLDVETVFRGETDRETVAVRLQGGELDDFIVESEDEAQIKIGASYIFFLYKPVSGRYVTEGDYYETVGGPQAVFTQIDRKEIAKTEKQFTVSHLDGVSAVSAFSLSEEAIFCNAETGPQESQTALSLNNADAIILAETVFEQEMEAFNKKVPVDPDFMEKEFKENLKLNLDSGFITQEEYDEAMHQAWNQAPYAEIVK